MLDKALVAELATDLVRFSDLILVLTPLFLLLSDSP
jgi:hypothetical protein